MKSVFSSASLFAAFQSTSDLSRAGIQNLAVRRTLDIKLDQSNTVKASEHTQIWLGLKTLVENWMMK